MPGHGIPMEAPALIELVSAYYGDVLDAVTRHEDPQDAVAEIAKKYPEYNTPDMLEGLLPTLYE